ncbi:MAG: hypothetical protein KDC93_18550, partial [Cyclobacteriaceae bacterium]|nr:hypothetical protein [Cyclobacteriaceae bacterium]
DEFFTIYPEVTKIVRFQGNDLDRELAVKRALDQLGKPYSLINFNCENFANHVQFGKSFSRQINTAIFLVVVITMVNLLSE